MGPDRKRNLIIGSVFLALLVGGLGVSLFLVNQKQNNQDIRSEASTNTGTAMVSISPTSGNITAGSSLPITISLNPAGNIISALAIRINYSYSGTTPDFTAENIQIDQALTSGGDWTCPVKKFTATGGKANIDIACANTSTIGYSNTAVVKLATVSLTATASAVNNTYTLAFDPKESIITKKSDSTDILLTPNSQGTYTVSGGIAITPGPSVIHKYRCSSYTCLLDDKLGTFTDTNCNSSCVRPVTPIVAKPNAPTLLRAGNPLLTIGLAAIGAIFSLASLLFLRH